MKYFIEFTVPIFCSCVVDTKTEEEAWDLINNYTFKQLKQLGYNPQVENLNYEANDCEVINVKPFQEKE